eukprot:7383768-Prymnesium_polylepis.1
MKASEHLVEPVCLQPDFTHHVHVGQPHRPAPANISYRFTAGARDSRCSVRDARLWGGRRGLSTIGGATAGFRRLLKFGRLELTDLVWRGGNVHVANAIAQRVTQLLRSTPGRQRGSCFSSENSSQRQLNVRCGAGRQWALRVAVRQRRTTFASGRWTRRTTARSH